MRHVILTTEVVAKLLQRVADDDIGCPIAGTDIGGGIHAPPEQSVTLHAWAIRKHPSLSQWAHPLPDAIVDRIVARIDAALAKGTITAAQATTLRARIAARAELAADWDGVEP